MQAWLNQHRAFLGDLLALTAAVETTRPADDGAPRWSRREVGSDETDAPERVHTVAFQPAVEASRDLACLGAALAATSLPAAGTFAERAPVRLPGIRRRSEGSQ